MGDDVADSCALTADVPPRPASFNKPIIKAVFKVPLHLLHAKHTGPLMKDHALNSVPGFSRTSICIQPSSSMGSLPKMKCDLNVSCRKFVKPTRDSCILVQVFLLRAKLAREMGQLPPGRLKILLAKLAACQDPHTGPTPMGQNLED